VTVTGDHPWDPWPGCETLAFRNPDGETVTFLMLAGAKARMMPPVAVATLAVPAGNGSRFLGAAHLERIVSVPVAVPGSITDRDELRRWARVLDPAKGEGALSVVQGAHAGRVLTCCYDAGLDELEETYPHVNEATLLFRAAWPYWAEGMEQSVRVTQGSTVRTWFPFLPLILGASDAFAVFNVTNTGDVPAWPVVTTVGPGTDLTAENLTTGARWKVTGPVAAGSTLVVDTRPGRKTATLDGANVFSRLTADSELWALAPGLNQVQVSLALTDPTASVTFAWRNLWLAA
jgi:hypothetical protein